MWNASTIAGSRKRANGILMNALYTGRIVWNRQRFIKDPETGKRVSRPNPESEWLTADAPALRVVDQETFEAAQKRKAARDGEQRYSATRPGHLLSGLLKCGCCGSGYIVVRRDKRGLVVGCSRVRETGLCDNGYTLGLEALETRVIESIDKHLAAPELIAEYVREFHARWRELRNTEEKRRRAIERELATIERELKRAVDAFIELRTRPLRDRVSALEAERERLEADLAAVPTPPIELHPNAAEHYRRQVAELKKTLASLSPDRRDEAFAGIRKLVEKIVIHPIGPYKPADLEIHGKLAALLRVSEEAAAAEYKSVGVVVAGVGFEPTTFRL